MPSTKEIIVAAAGSGKTSRIVKEALATSKRSVIITYTLNNTEEIRKKIFEINGSIPNNITVMTWFTFLLHDLVRPYQNFIYEPRVESLYFVQGQSTQGIRKSNIATYFFSGGKNIYSDKISEFAAMCNTASNGLVLDRLSHVYDHIYIDEVQDLAGYDLDLVELLLNSPINITVVGDNRQATYQTNNSPKNKRYIGVKVLEKFKVWEKAKKCTIQYLQHSHRCNQAICDLADAFYPTLPKTTSRNLENSGHDGVFVISSAQINEYTNNFKPQVLRYNRTTKCEGQEAINFGDAKGLTFDRILIFPHGPLKRLLETGDFKSVEASPAKLYVAVTRARNSVAIVYDGKLRLPGVEKWAGTARL
jgi:DNA helicase II / ATP-dependent DNA helicase PcrA